MNRIILFGFISFCMLCLVPVLAIIAGFSTFFWVLFEGFQSVWRMGE